MMVSIDVAACSQFARPALTFGKPGLTEEVLPTDAIPVVDVQRERYDLFGSESARQFPAPLIRRGVNRPRGLTSAWSNFNA